MAVGKDTNAAVSTPNLAAALSLVSAMPALLVEAHRITATALAGWHGRRRAGRGESFWQFRPFSSGEAAATIDWRRSGRDEHLYVREREWEAAHTIWIAPDLSASMAFRSKLASTEKRSRAILISLALAELLAQAGERVGVLGQGQPTRSRNASERIAAGLVATPPVSWPNIGALRRHSDLIVISDFLDPIEMIVGRLEDVAAIGARAFLLQINDPVEETFPYRGRTEFFDTETGISHLVGRAEALGEAYRLRLEERRDRLAETCRKLDWTFLRHRTDRPATEPLLAIYARLSDRHARLAGREHAA